MANWSPAVKNQIPRNIITPRKTNAPFGVWNADCAEDRQQWISHWKAWPAREVAAHPAYMQLFVSDQSERTMAAYWKSEKGCVLYPFILRDIDTTDSRAGQQDRWSDITSPYGYGGPFSWGQNEEHRQNLATPFWQSFEDWAAHKRVVSEFVRFSLFDYQLLDFPGNNVSKLTNVVCPLNRSEEELWHSVRPKVRRNVNKARREGVSVLRDDSAEFMDDFLRVYTSTMDRRQACQYYYFPPEFFNSLNKNLAGQFTYFHAIHQGAVISSELVLISAENVYFFLGGTDSQHYSLRPNDLLKYEIMCWANKSGKKHYVLGGGYEEKDGVFQYKKSFAPDGLVSFSVGQRVHNQSAYQRLSERHLVAGPTAEDSFFPLYRAA